MTLKEYNKKRNFLASPEPKGKLKKQSKKLKFVVQYHKARAKHFDFRLEWNGVLLSFAVPKGLSYNPEEKRLAVHVEDHPLDYANFEGIIPEGNYGAGSVEIYDHGFYTPSFDMDKGLKKGHLKFVLDGEKYKGEWSLVKMDEKNWLLIKSQDDFAKKEDKRNKKLPFSSTQLSLQLAQLTSTIPSGKEWFFEIKFDGYRLLSFVENGKVKCVTRGGQDYTKKFSKIAESLSLIDEDSFVVDGEVVAFDKNGKSDFGLLQSCIKIGEGMTYVIFDLLALNGDDLRKLPLVKRKQLLLRLFSKKRDCLLYSEHIEGNGKKCFDFALKNNLEGIIAKNKNSSYTGTRNGDWLKIKCYCRQEFVICGFLTTAANKNLSALLVGYFDSDKLVYVGKVGTGFNENERENLNKKLNQIKVKTCPVDVFPEQLKNVDTFWVKPVLVAEIQFAQLTKDRVLRQASFVGLRDDKNAKQVKLEGEDEGLRN